jgi:hypothetical protein
MAPAPQTWILTGSPETFAATREPGFRLAGPKDEDADADLLVGRLREAASAVAA